MTVLNLEGRPYVLAAYTCTPLVTIPVDQLVDGAHVKGKTIGELGYGNSPVDMIHFQSRDAHGKEQDNVLITHKVRGPMLFQVASIEESNRKEGLSSGVGTNVVAPAHMAVPMGGFLHVDNQDEQFLVALRRDTETGRLSLLSYRKGLYFRASDFVSEFMLPGFPFSSMSEHFQQYHRTVQREEGFL